MREKMLENYFFWRDNYLKECKEEKEKIKSEEDLRKAIHWAEVYKERLNGMIQLMSSMNIITNAEYEKERKRNESAFNTYELYDAIVNFFSGKPIYRKGSFMEKMMENKKEV